MRPTFRTKVMAIVGIAAFAFLLVISTGALMAKRVERQLGTIQARYLPKIDLEPQLESQFERIRRGFQDAVAIRDADALGESLAMKSGFLDHLAAARDAVESGQATALRAAFDAYCTAAYDVSRHLIP